MTQLIQIIESTEGLTLLQYFDSFLTMIAMSFAIWAFVSGRVMPRKIVDEIVTKNNESLARQISESMGNSVKNGIKGAFAEMGIKGRRADDAPPAWAHEPRGD